MARTISPVIASLLDLFDLVQYDYAPYLLPRGANVWVDTSQGTIEIGFTAWTDQRAAQLAWLTGKVKAVLHRDALKRVTITDFSDYRPSEHGFRRPHAAEEVERKAGQKGAGREAAHVREPRHVHAR